jgi:DNA mismatch endonuclease (patch repair protein)
MDRHTPEQRSKNMRAIKSTGTKPELILSKALWHLGHRYRKNNKTVFGRPDLTFKEHRIAIFIDSEFFHGKDWETRKKPQTNAEFWEKKILRNMERDTEVNEFLQQSGWLVFRFWSKEIMKNLPEIITVIEAALSAAKNKLKRT